MGDHLSHATQAAVATLLTFVVCTIGLALYLRKQRGQSTTDIAISSAFVGTVSVVALGVAAIAEDLHPLLVVAVLSGVAISLSALARSLSIVPYGTPMLVLAFAAIAVVVTGAVFPATGFALFDVPFSVIAIWAFSLICREVDAAPGVLAPVAVVMLSGITLIGFGRGDHQLQTLTAAGVGGALALIWWTRMGGRGTIGPGAALFIGFALLTAIAGLRGPFWVAAFPIASGLLVIPIADSATVFESRRKLKQPMFTPRADHLSHRLLAVGFSSTSTVALLVVAAGIGTTASCLTAFKIIPWYVGLCIAWATKITIVTWAIKHPVPTPEAEQAASRTATS
ncbi:MAG: hypothetical protein WC054_12485 [Candidatus Nanopelagicales bacterium]